MGNIRSVKPGEWQAVEASAKPVLVDFWAEWCGPCRMIAPALEKLAENFGRDFDFVKLNVDELPEVAGKFGIRAIPTLLLLKDGKVAEQIVGARSYNDLAKVLENHRPTPVKVN